MFKSFKNVFVVLGVIVATLSVASLIQLWFDVGLTGVTEKILENYRSIRDTAKWALFDWWSVTLWPNFTLPGWAMDAMAVWMLSAAAFVRAHGTHMEAIERSVRRNTEQTFEKTRVRLVLDQQPRWALARAVFLGPIGIVGYWFYCLRVIVESLDVKSRRTPEQEGDLRYLFLPTAETQEISRRAAFTALFASVVPILGAILFFVWNGIQL